MWPQGAPEWLSVAAALAWSPSRAVARHRRGRRPVRRRRPVAPGPSRRARRWPGPGADATVVVGASRAKRRVCVRPRAALRAALPRTARAARRGRAAGAAGPGRRVVEPAAPLGGAAPGGRRHQAPGHARSTARGPRDRARARPALRLGRAAARQPLRHRRGRPPAPRAAGAPGLRHRHGRSASAARGRRRRLPRRAAASSGCRAARRPGRRGAPTCSSAAVAAASCAPSGRTARGRWWRRRSPGPTATRCSRSRPGRRPRPGRVLRCRSRRCAGACADRELGQARRPGRRSPGARRAGTFARRASSPGSRAHEPGTRASRTCPQAALFTVSRGLDALTPAEASEMRVIYQQVWEPVPETERERMAALLNGDPGRPRRAGGGPPAAARGVEGGMLALPPAERERLQQLSGRAVRKALLAHESGGARPPGLAEKSRERFEDLASRLGPRRAPRALPRSRRTTGGRCATCSRATSRTRACASSSSTRRRRPSAS